MSLGKLSAGLAHELNNPAAAIRGRATSSLAAAERSATSAARCSSAGPRPAGFAPIEALAGSSREPPARRRGPDRSERGGGGPHVMARGRGLGDAWLAAETLVSAGVSGRQLGEATDALPDALIPSALRWLEADLGVAGACSTTWPTQHAGSRSSWRRSRPTPTWTGAPRRPRSTARGIRSTLAMLGTGQQRRGQGGTELDPELPPVRANPGELNQVWTNLIDNAVDAAGPGGEIEIRTSQPAARWWSR